MQLLYIGDLPIRSDRSGGPVVLWRHQQLFCGRIASADSLLGYQPQRGFQIARLLRRLRLSRLALILQPWLWSLDIRIQPHEIQYIRSNADAILTVGHGLTWLQAIAAARHTGLPLVTVVHDWYPDASGCPRWGLWLWQLTFYQLLHRSSLIFAVSTGMARQIGEHPNLQLLPPIPDPELQPCPPRQPHGGPWRLYYSGLCGGIYQPLLQSLIDAVADDPRFALHCSGEEHQNLKMAAAEGRLRTSGFLDGELWQQAFNEADALVVVLNFERRHRRHLATHFPSKLVEYANRGRPIVIWGPPWSSAVQWGQSAPHVLTHTTVSARHLIDAIDAWLPYQPISIPPAQAFSAAQISEQFERGIKSIFSHSQVEP